MGKGGKNKKQGTREGRQQSTSQVPTSSSAAVESVAEASTNVPVEPPKVEAVPAQPAPVEEEEYVGLGLGKKKTRRKKKDGASQATGAAGDVQKQEHVQKQEQQAPKQEQQAPKQEQHAPKQEHQVLKQEQCIPKGQQQLTQPMSQMSLQETSPLPAMPAGPSIPGTRQSPTDFPSLSTGWGRGCGRGRGRGEAPAWGAKGPARAPLQSPQEQKQPPTSLPLSRATEGNVGQSPQYPSFPVPTSAPREQRPPQAQVPVAGRGRGQVQPMEKKISVTSQPPSRQPTDTAVCRFKIPDKIVGRSAERPIQLLTNYLEMRIKPMKVYRYDVSIKPEKPKKLAPRAFYVAKSEYFPRNIIAFDQKKNCYTTAPLWTDRNDRKSINVEIKDDNDKPMQFELIFIFTGVVDFTTILNHMKDRGSSLNTPSEAIQCVDVILQQATLQSYVKAGRQYFKRPRNPIDLGFGLEMWTGLFQSAIFTSRAFINIDVAHKGFPRQQQLVDALVKDFRLDPTKPIESQRSYNIEYFNQFLRGLRVKAFVGGDSRGGQRREYICNGLVDPPNKLMFDMTDSDGTVRRITVEKYFTTEKKCRLRYPNLNCVWVGPRDKSIYYPMELLEVSGGQALNKQLNDKQLPTMVREAATPPNERLKKIRDIIQDMNYSSNPHFKNFQLDISNEFFRVNGRVLQAPKIDIGSGRPIDPVKGVWRTNSFLRASVLDSWGLIAIDTDPNSCQANNFISMLMKTGQQMGMVVNEPKFTKFSVRMNEVRQQLMFAYEKRINFMFVIVSGRDKDCYHKVKKMAELDVGILTQCIKEMTAARRMNDQTVRNILLKVNSKLMGINQALDERTLPQCLRGGGVMIVGADVTHPSPEQSSVPSIAAVTASIDQKCFLYNIELSIQNPKKEMIVDFEEMMFDHLQVYKKHQRALPRKIYVFRDGVSEGQFAQVMNTELVAVHRAYQRLDRNIKPEVLFLLVQKRHHTRFFLGEGNPQNVLPGTVVDTDIVHPRELDFYLVSHQAIKGTARPTRYHAVCNDGGLRSDEVEQLTYYLCHLYARCTRSVSYPTPTYYAHLACLRARSLTFGDRFNNTDLERAPKRLRVLDRMLECSRMFFV